tara:strand:- start:52 stop:204 length:153 start_codon:yes stop_codon:yes gene_type:complete
MYVSDEPSEADDVDDAHDSEGVVWHLSGDGFHDVGFGLYNRGVPLSLAIE